MDVRSYWKARALKWERLRYGAFSLINPASFPLQARRRIATQWVMECSRREPGLWVDLGCGSGHLREQLGAGFSGSYLGVDLSEEAIALAKKRFAGSPKDSFVCADVMLRETPPSQGWILLGLSDWLTRSELRELLQRASCQNFILSYTLERGMFFRPYRTYHQATRSRLGSLFPLVYRREEIVELGEQAGFQLLEEKACGFSPGRIQRWVKARIP